MRSASKVDQPKSCKLDKRWARRGRPSGAHVSLSAAKSGVHVTRPSLVGMSCSDSSYHVVIHHSSS